MRPEEFYENKMVIEASRIEDNSLVIGSGKMGNSIPHLDHSISLHVLGTDEDGEREKQADEYGNGRWHSPYQARTFYVGGKTQGGSGKKYQDEPGAIIRKIDLTGKIKPEHNSADRESQCRNAQFSARFHQRLFRFWREFGVPECRIRARLEVILPELTARLNTRKRHPQ